jgi:hypothetical protein
VAMVFFTHFLTAMTIALPQPFVAHFLDLKCGIRSH